LVFGVEPSGRDYSSNARAKWKKRLIAADFPQEGFEADGECVKISDMLEP
jgi:hypothetical protein